MHEGMGNSLLVPGTWYCTQNSSYLRQIQYLSRPSLEIGQTSQYRMVVGSFSGIFHLSNAQISHCGFVRNSIQSQTPIVCISNSRQSSLGGRSIISGLELPAYICISTNNSDTFYSWPWWLSWMRCPTGDQEVTGSTPAEVGNILSWRLIMKYFLRSFSPFRWFKKGSCQFLAKECAQYWLTA